MCIRVLFLCHRYTDISLGGLAEFLHFLPLALLPYQIESLIYTPEKNHTHDQLREENLLPNGIKHFTGPMLKPQFFTSQRELNPLIDLCCEERINLIHAQGIYRAGYMAMQAYQKIKIPYMITSHSDVLMSHSKRMRQWHIQQRCKKIISRSAFISHLSPLMEKAANQLCDTTTKSKIIHNGVDVKAWETYQRLPEKDYILAIGRLEPEKGFPLLLESYAQLAKTGLKTSFVIAGSGSLEENLKQQANLLGLKVINHWIPEEPLPSSSVIFTGYVRDHHKKLLFSHAKIVLFAPQTKIWEEPFGIVQLETMAAGKALIASETTITRYLHSLGLEVQFAQDHPLNWADAMCLLLSNPKLRQMMGKKNRETVGKFSWDIIAKEYADVYRNTIDQRFASFYRD